MLLLLLSFLLFPSSFFLSPCSNHRSPSLFPPSLFHSLFSPLSVSPFHRFFLVLFLCLVVFFLVFFSCSFSFFVGRVFLVVLFWSCFFARVFFRSCFFCRFFFSCPPPPLFVPFLLKVPMFSCFSCCSCALSCFSVFFTCFFFRFFFSMFFSAL